MHFCISDNIPIMWDTDGFQIIKLQAQLLMQDAQE